MLKTSRLAIGLSSQTDGVACEQGSLTSSSPRVAISQSATDSATRPEMVSGSRPLLRHAKPDQRPASKVAAEVRPPCTPSAQVRDRSLTRLAIHVRLTPSVQAVKIP